MRQIIVFDILEMQCLTTELLRCVHLIRWELTVDGQGTLKHIDLDMALPSREFAVKNLILNHLVLEVCPNRISWGTG